MSGKIIRQKIITRFQVRASLGSKVFVFGDNIQQRGYGGQAQQMRGEPNTIGIPTKWNPNTKPNSFFDDADFDRVKPTIDAQFDKIWFRLNRGFDVVIPEDGVGTGFAELPKRAPKIYDYIQTRLAELEKL